MQAPVKRAGEPNRITRPPAPGHIVTAYPHSRECADDGERKSHLRFDDLV